MNSRTCTRSLLGNFFVSRASMSTKKKSPTHYDTLEVNPRATQGEIKTAYFNLSKQYHPDKNSSEEAVVKFRDVTEAYEVIGNFNSRKNYDRSLLTHTQYPGRRHDAKPADPKIKYYQSQAAVFKSERAGGTQPLYDFDAWTKAHYGKTFEKTLKRRAEGLKKREERVRDHMDNFSKEQGITLSVALIFLTSLIYLSLHGREEYDDVALKFQHREQVAESESKSAEPRSDAIRSN